MITLQPGQPTKAYFYLLYVGDIEFFTGTNGEAIVVQVIPGMTSDDLYYEIKLKCQDLGINSFTDKQVDYALKNLDCQDLLDSLESYLEDIMEGDENQHVTIVLELNHEYY